MQRWDQVGKVILVFLMLSALLLLFLLLPVARVQVSYVRRRGGDDQFAVRASAWHGLLRYTFVWPAVTPGKKVRQKDGDGPDQGGKVMPLSRFLRTASVAANITRLYGRHILGLLKKARLSCLTWRTEIGTGDPCQTGLLTGAVWGLKGIILTAFYRMLSPGGAAPALEVRPSFDKTCFNTALDCAFEIRLGHLFVAGVKYFIHKKKNFKKATSP